MLDLISPRKTDGRRSAKLSVLLNSLSQKRPLELRDLLELTHLKRIYTVSPFARWLYPETNKQLERVKRLLQQAGL